MTVDHIVPERVMESIGLTAHAPWNLVTLCASCHSRKTCSGDRLILAGDAKGFMLILKEIGYPLMQAHEALLRISAILQIRNMLGSKALDNVSNLEVVQNLQTE